MAHPAKAPSGLLFVSLLYHQDKTDGVDWQALLPAAPTAASQVEFCFPCSPMATYYSREMGQVQKLVRKAFLLLRPQSRDAAIEFKLKSYEYEQEHSEDGRRTINIDSGLLTLENFQLLTFKPYSHRIFLRDGVYAELTLQYEQGEFRTLPWTYPDYAHSQTISFFQWGRAVLYNELR